MVGRPQPGDGAEPPDRRRDRRPQPAHRPPRDPRRAAEPHPGAGLRRLSLVVFLIAVWQLPSLTHVLWPIPVVGFVIYPYLKRFTWTCHFFLGAVDGLAAARRLDRGHQPPGARPVPARRRRRALDRRVRHHLRHHGSRHRPRPGPQLGAAALRHRRARSPSPGPRHLISVVLLVWLGLSLGLGPLYYLGVAVIAGLLTYENSIVSEDDLSRVDMAFLTMNGVIAMVFLVGVAARCPRLNRRSAAPAWCGCSASGARSHGLDLEVAAGETVVVTGPNGAGKTTLLRVLATVLRPSAGDGVGSRATRSRRRRCRPGRRSATSATSRSSTPGLTARENLELYAALFGVTPSGSAPQLELVGLGRARRPTSPPSSRAACSARLGDRAGHAARPRPAAARRADRRPRRRRPRRAARAARAPPRPHRADRDSRARAVCRPSRAAGSGSRAAGGGVNRRALLARWCARISCSSCAAARWCSRWCVFVLAAFVLFRFGLGGQSLAGGTRAAVGVLWIATVFTAMLGLTRIVCRRARGAGVGRPARRPGRPRDASGRPAR